MFHVLKIDRTTTGTELALTEDETVYSGRQIVQLLAMIEDGNRSTGGMRKIATAHAILGAQPLPCARSLPTAPPASGPSHALTHTGRGGG